MQVRKILQDCLKKELPEVAEYQSIIKQSSLLNNRLMISISASEQDMMIKNRLARRLGGEIEVL